MNKWNCRVNGIIKASGKAYFMKMLMGKKVFTYGIRWTCKVCQERWFYSDEDMKDISKSITIEDGVCCWCKKYPNRLNKQKTEKGYVLVKVPGQTKRVLEHRKVMSDHIGEDLEPYEIVHHLNGIKDDNRVENLIICSNRSHSNWVLEFQKRIKTLEDLLEKEKAKNDEKHAKDL